MKADIESILLYMNIFLLTLAIGINAHSVYVRFQTPPDREYCSA